VVLGTKTHLDTKFVGLHSPRQLGLVENRQEGLEHQTPEHKMAAAFSTN